MCFRDVGKVRDENKRDKEGNKMKERITKDVRYQE